jgi:hypothetical protein
MQPGDWESPRFWLDNQLYIKDDIIREHEIPNLCLEHSASIQFLYKQNTKVIIHLIIFVPSTEFFYHIWATKETRDMDARYNIASKLASIREDMDETYSEDRGHYYREKWRTDPKSAWLEDEKCEVAEKTRLLEEEAQ